MSGSDSPENFWRRSCNSSSQGHPNHASSQAPDTPVCMRGLIRMVAGQAVWKRFQPPSAGAFFSARREVRVDQSMAWSSTLTPISRRSWALTRLAEWSCGMSVG